MARRKKSYNPFKMWGAWVGAILGLFVVTWVAQSKDSVIFDVGFFGLYNIGILSPILYSLTGFLIGWGIHSLIRRYK